jgi:lipoprotein-anchoring transpeptidase ErfK/SrfK
MQSMSEVTRRVIVLGLPIGLAGCATGGNPAMYAAEPAGRFAVPPIDLAQIDPKFYRQEADYQTSEPRGTVVVDPGHHFLYYVEGGGKATRYGVGVGREGFAWHGTAAVRRKAEWPTWTPPEEMTKRDKEAAKYASGMPGGLNNPLGARAMYLYQGDRDTLYRIHGTTEPWSIGQSMSSGCIRLLDQDIIDLYNRVPVGTKVIVLPA